MARQIPVLTDPAIKREVHLQLPTLGYLVSSTPGGLKISDAEEFCALYAKISKSTAIFEGIIHIDFDTSHIRRGRWNYGVSTSRVRNADTLEPFSLVVLQQVTEWTTCTVEMRNGQKTLVVTSPHAVIYAKAARGTEVNGPSPTPTLPPAIGHSYTAVFESDIKELAICMDGTVSVTTY